MARPEYRLRFTCKHPGCQEHVTFRYSTARDRSASFELSAYGKDGWLCSRHRNPDEVLSASNPETRFEAVSYDSHGRRFINHSGMVSGPGFKMFVDDFPEGTRLIVTARIELPGGATQEQS